MVLTALAEGLDPSAAERVFGYRQDTISTWLTRAGEYAQTLHERSFRNLWLPHLQLDELRKMSSQGLIELSTISNGCTHRASMYPYGTIMAVLYTRMRV